METEGPVTHRRVLRLAGPIVLSNISTPLLGLADMVVIGRIPNPAALGAIALGGTIFNFVYWGFGWAVKGVATGTLIAETAAACLGAALAWRDLRRIGWTGRWTRARLLDPARLARMIAVNRDIMLRTFCLIFVFAFFTAQGARAGDVTLAANAVLGQFIALSAFLLDAFCAATEALVGAAVGARDRVALERTVLLSSIWAGGVALALSVALFLAGPFLIDALSASPDVRAAARVYLPWAALAPVIAVWCFLLDGIFIGATRTAEMRNAMAATLAIFLGAWWMLAPAYGNHGLWAALLIFYFVRAATLLPFFGSVRRAALSPDR
jgi:MATE family multidrug resistance protein